MTVTNTHKLVGEALKVMPGVFAILDDSMNVVSSSSEWDREMGSSFEREDVVFKNQFEEAFKTAIKGSSAYFTEDLPKIQTRFKWKFVKIPDDKNDAVLVQQVLLTRPKDYRTELLLQERKQTPNLK